jgi:hypothetical protein
MNWPVGGGDLKPGPWYSTSGWRMAMKRITIQTMMLGIAALPKTMGAGSAARDRAVQVARTGRASLVLAEEPGELAGNVELLIVVLHGSPRIEVPRERPGLWYVSIGLDARLSVRGYRSSLFA